MKRSTILALLSLLADCPAENWPQFRGPTGLGYTAETNLPLTWNAATGENIAWKMPLPKGDSQFSSPIVWGGNVIVTGVTNAPLQHRVMRFAMADGKLKWETEVAPGPLVLTDLRGGYGAPTTEAARSRRAATTSPAMRPPAKPATRRCCHTSRDPSAARAVC